MDFAQKLKEIRAKNYSDLEIAEELSTLTKQPVSRQVVYNYRTGRRPNPAKFEICMAILRLHKRIMEGETAWTNPNTPTT